MISLVTVKISHPLGDVDAHVELLVSPGQARPFFQYCCQVVPRHVFHLRRNISAYTATTVNLGEISPEGIVNAIHGAFTSRKDGVAMVDVTM